MREFKNEGGRVSLASERAAFGHPNKTDPTRAAFGRPPCTTDFCNKYQNVSEKNIVKKA